MLRNVILLLPRETLPDPDHPTNGELPIERFDLALQLDQQRVALAIDLLAHSHFHPAFADAVFLDIHALLAIEADANVAFENGWHMVGAARVNREAIG